MFIRNSNTHNNDSLLGGEEGERRDSAQHYFDNPIGSSAYERRTNNDDDGIKKMLGDVKCTWGCFFLAYVLIFSLFAIYNVNRGNSTTTTSSSPYVVASTYETSGGVSQTDVGGSLVSSTQSDGKNMLQTGAGVTAYSTGYGSMVCPKYLTLVPLHQNDFMLTSSSSKDNGQTTYNILNIPPSAPDSPVGVSGGNNDYGVYQQVTLDEANGIFVFVPNHDDDPNTDDVYIMAGQSQSADDENIVYSSDQFKYTSSPFPFPVITRMDESTIALVYYDNTTIKSRFASVNSDLEVKFSNEVEVCSNTEYATNFYGAGLSSSRYLITCCDKCQTNVPNADSATLQGNMETHVLDATTDDHGDLVVKLKTDPSSNGILSGATGAGAIRMDRVDKSSAILVFADVDDAYALRGVLLQVIIDPATGDPMVSYGSSYTFSEGASLKKSCTSEDGCVLMDFDIKAVTLDGYTAIVTIFADASNSYRTTISGCKMNSVNALVSLFDKMPLTSGDHSGSDYVWTAIASNNEGQIAMASVYTDGNCDAITPLITVLEIKPDPVGIITSISTGSVNQATVSMKGSDIQLAGESSFNAGKIILTSSMGDLVEGPSVGRVVDTYFATSGSDKTRVYDLKSSQVGVALGGNNILVETHSN